MFNIPPGMFADAAMRFLLAFPFILIYHILMLKKHKKAQKRGVFPHIIAAYVFCFIVSFVFSATGIPDTESFRLYMMRVSLTPFVIENNEQLLLNILLFVPFGFFAPLLWKRFQNIFRTFFLGFFFSLFIEVSQLFCHRVSDIDDLIMNTIGTLIGFVLFWILKLIIPGLGNFFCKGSVFKKSEIYCYVAIIFITSFFLRPLVHRIFML